MTQEFFYKDERMMMCDKKDAKFKSVYELDDEGNTISHHIEPYEATKKISKSDDDDE